MKYSLQFKITNTGAVQNSKVMSDKLNTESVL